ncbi:MAG: acetoacetate decarboxylase family protein [Chloroflexaceae bacterium]|nr:acetoacetate decarboxylase family protein [Chloroflexaceae bacterium]
MNTETTLPLQFDNTLCVNIALPLPSHQARALVPAGTPINLVEVFPGRAVLVISFSHYRESPFGDYTEAVIALMATHERSFP